MDPNANLAEQIRLADRLESDDTGPDAAAALRLAELVLAMNEWIRGGGFLPDAWNRAAKGTP